MHWLVLTREEKRVLVFVLAALVLGITGKYYRDQHPHASDKIDKKHSQSHAASPTATPKKRARKPRKKPYITPVAPAAAGATE